MIGKQAASTEKAAPTAAATLFYMAFVGGSGIKVGKKVAWRWSPLGGSSQLVSS